MRLKVSNLLKSIVIAELRNGPLKTEALRRSINYRYATRLGRTDLGVALATLRRDRRVRRRAIGNGWLWTRV